MKRFLIVAEIEVHDEYVQEMGGSDDAASTIAGSLEGLLNDANDQGTFDYWRVVDSTVYPLREE